MLLWLPTAPAGASEPERVRMLKGTALFAETPKNVLATIVPITQEVSYAAGQEVFAKGALGTSLLLVCHGEAAILNGVHHLATSGPGDFFWGAGHARCRAAVGVFRPGQEDFYNLMEERPEVLRNILRGLCRRLRQQNEHSPALA